MANNIATGYIVPRNVIEAYIRQAAAARGINPNTAVTVYRREGVNNWQSEVEGGKFGLREPSYGPFQLLVGGKGTGYGRGVGNKMLAAGIDPRDPKNWKQSVDFALNEASRRGWGQWYGAKAAGITGFAGIRRGRELPVIRPPGDIPNEAVAETPTTKSNKTVALSDTPTLSELQPSIMQAASKPEPFKLSLPTETAVSNTPAPAATLNQESPTSLPPMRMASMAPNIKAPTPKLAATSESGIATIIGLIREGKGVKGLSPSFDALTPAQQANVINLVKGADETQLPGLVQKLEKLYPNETAPIASRGRQAASPAEKIVGDSIAASDEAPVKMTTTKKDETPKTVQPSMTDTGAPPINPKGVPIKDILGPDGRIIYDQYNRRIDSSMLDPKPIAQRGVMSPSTALAAGGAGAAAVAMSGKRQERDPVTGVEGLPSEGSGVGGGSFDDTGMGGPPNTATRTIPPGATIDPNEAAKRRAAQGGASPRPASNAQPATSGDVLANEMIERALGLPKGTLNDPARKQAVINAVGDQVRSKVAQDPEAAQAAVGKAAQEDAAAAVQRRSAPMQLQQRPNSFTDMGGSPTSSSDRMTDFAAQNPGMNALMQYFVGGPSE